MNTARTLSTAINQELLRTFLAAADSRNFSQAAHARHVTKSAISQQVRTLESQLGVLLFERSGRAVRLTPSGSELARVLRQEFAAIDDAIDALVQDHGAVRGEVRLGAPRPFARHWLRSRLAELANAYPELHIHVIFGTPTTLERLLLDRTLDLTILVREPRSPLVETETIFRERFSLYASPEYLKRAGTPSSLESFATHRWIVFDNDMPMLTAWWKSRFDVFPLRGRVSCSVSSLDEMLGLTESGVGLCVLPDYFTKDALKKGTIVEVSGKQGSPVSNDIFLAWRSNAILSARFRAARDSLLGHQKVESFSGEAKASSFAPRFTSASQSVA